MTEFLLAPLGFLAAFSAAIGAIFCLMKLSQMLRNKESAYLPYIFYSSTLVSILTHIATGRNLFAQSMLGATELSDNSLSFPPYYLWISRANTTFILFVACQWLVSRLMRYGTKPDTPTLLIGAFLFLYFTNVLTPALFSAHPSFDHKYVYLSLLGVASLFAQDNEDAAIRAARNSLYIFLLVSAACIPWNPGLVLSDNYLEGVIPGLTYRYAGLANHANSLGPIIVLFLLCLYSKPYARRWINFLGWILGYASLVLAQSKTSWIGFIMCMCCMGYFKYGAFFKRRLFDVNNPVLSAMFIVMAMITVSAVSAGIMLSDIEGEINAFFSTRAGADLTTMTGRTPIWEVALSEWRNSPLFGYGLTLWDAAHQTKIGMPWAFDAHNQFIQTLASAGLVGAAGLAIYVATLFWFTLKTAKSSQGLTLAIFLMIFSRSITEVPLPIFGFDFNSLTHILLLMIIGAQFKYRRIEKTNRAVLAAYPKPAIYRGQI